MEADSNKKLLSSEIASKISLYFPLTIIHLFHDNFFNFLYLICQLIYFVLYACILLIYRFLTKKNLKKLYLHSLYPTMLL